MTHHTTPPSPEEGEQKTRQQATPTGTNITFWARHWCYITLQIRRIEKESTDEQRTVDEEVNLDALYDEKEIAETRMLEAYQETNP